MAKRRRIKKKLKPEKPLSAFNLTCLKCREEIDEHTDAVSPAVLIFDCLGCGSHWVVGSTTFHNGGGKPVD